MQQIFRNSSGTEKKTQERASLFCTLDEYWTINKNFLM